MTAGSVTAETLESGPYHTTIDELQRQYRADEQARREFDNSVAGAASNGFDAGAATVFNSLWRTPAGTRYQDEAFRRAGLKGTATETATKIFASVGTTTAKAAAGATILAPLAAAIPLSATGTAVVGTTVTGLGFTHSYYAGQASYYNAKAGNTDEAIDWGTQSAFSFGLSLYGGVQTVKQIPTMVRGQVPTNTAPSNAPAWRQYEERFGGQQTPMTTTFQGKTVKVRLDKPPSGSTIVDFKDYDWNNSSYNKPFIQKKVAEDFTTQIQKYQTIQPNVHFQFSQEPPSWATRAVESAGGTYSVKP